MGDKGRGWHGDSRLHSLARKGISTTIDDKRRFSVNNFVARGERKRIKYKQDFKGKIYNVTVERPEDIELTLYLAEYLFLSQLKNESHLERFFTHEGRLSDYEKEKLKKVKVIKIEEVTQKEESPFKSFGKLKEFRWNKYGKKR